jgi:hypothetical protein
MRTFARITAIIFILLGLVIILIAVWFAASGIQVNKPTAPSLFPDFSGLIVLARLVGGIAIGLQGLFLSAIGEGLWLVAGIHEHSQLSAELLSILVRHSQSQ